MRRRKGFTITELLVAMALIIFIMYILAEAFASGAGAFRKLKAIGDMNEKLRTSLGLMRKYLQADHFEGKKRLSDPDFWRDGPPKEGFLRLYQVTDGAYEGSDVDGNPSYSSADHGLHFFVKLRGNNRGDFFRTTIVDTSTAGGSPLLRLPYLDTRFQEGSSTTLCSPGAEVAFFMRNSGEVAEDVENLGLAPQTLYTLYLRQRLCIPDNELITQLGMTRVAVAEYRGYVDMSCYQDPAATNFLFFNNPADLTMPRRRLNPALDAPTNNAAAPAVEMANAQPVYSNRILEEDPTAALAMLAGNDILLTNVLSFDVRILIPKAHFNQMITAYDAAFPPNPVTPDSLLPRERVYDFISLHHRAFKYWMPTLNPTINATTHRVFDTWSGAKDDAYDYSVWRPSSFTDATMNQPQTIPLVVDRTGQTLLRPLAIQITLRIWDSNTKQTRQSSIVVDL